MKVLLAVSGGIDSMCMAQKYLHRELQCEHFAVAHCNFHLRADESDRDEDFVQRWCEAHEVQFFKNDFNTTEVAEKTGRSIEMTARDLRYEWFAKICRDEGFDAVAVAHNANDNAETVILNLLRGTGSRGLCAMKESHRATFGGIPVTIIRPLLRVSREDIRSYMSKGGYDWVEDSTNGQSEVKRNIIRNDIFPIFGKINPSFIQTLSRDISAVAQVDSIADDYFNQVQSDVKSGGRIYFEPLLGLKHWKYVLFRLLEPTNASQGTVEDIASLLEESANKDSSGNVTLSGKTFITATHRINLSRQYIEIQELSETPRLPEQDCVVVRGVGKYNLGGTLFTVEIADVDSFEQPEGSTIASIDSLPFPFIVRRWRSGDWMIPLGLKGRKKISDMFTDLKFDSHQKRNALIAVIPSWNAEESSTDNFAAIKQTDQCHVGALLGYRIDKALKVTDKSRSVIRITLPKTK